MLKLCLWPRVSASKKEPNVLFVVDPFIFSKLLFTIAYISYCQHSLTENLFTNL